MTIEEWLQTVPEDIIQDPIWRRQDYRIASYIADSSWSDVEKLSRHPATRSLADQLYRSLSSIGVNLAEGYSRGSGADRVRFYEYALGSARESREWYYKGRHVIGQERAADQSRLLTSVIRLLLAAIPAERQERMSRPRRGR